MSQGTWAGEIVVRISDFDDVSFLDWIRGGTFICNWWPYLGLTLRLVMVMCRLSCGCSRHPIPTSPLPWLGGLDTNYSFGILGSLHPLPSSYYSTHETYVNALSLSFLAEDGILPF